MWKASRRKIYPQVFEISTQYPQDFPQARNEVKLFYSTTYWKSSTFPQALLRLLSYIYRFFLEGKKEKEKKLCTS